jgi:membrane protease YdiL (CAAX protease family)
VTTPAEPRPAAATEPPAAAPGEPADLSRPEAVEAAAPAARESARWRPRVAIAVVVVGLVVCQAAAFAVVLAAGGDDASDAANSASFVVADLLLVAIIVTFASRGAERLTGATLGVRRTPFWRAVGWTLAIWVGIVTLEGLYALLVGGFSNVEEDPGITEGEMIFVLFAIAVVTPIAEELAFRGYLFPALTRWRGPWIGALITALVFGAAHVGSSPVLAVPALALFGFGACLLFWFTGSLLPCVGLHAANNALVMSVGGDWTWEVLVAVVGCVTLSVLLMLPFARERAPYAAA